VGVLSVDFVLPKHRIAIELDGPSHFLIKEDGSLKLSGTTIAKQRVLAKCGEFDHVF
jgi:very-short-patch-repair endonuclease